MSHQQWIQMDSMYYIDFYQVSNVWIDSHVHFASLGAVSVTGICRYSFWHCALTIFGATCWILATSDAMQSL